MNPVIDFAVDDDTPAQEVRACHTGPALTAAAVTLVAVVALSLLAPGPRPSRAERDRAAVEAVADHFTHQQIAAAWTQMKIGNYGPLHTLERTFPVAPRTVYEDGPGIVMVFAGHNGTCVDFVSEPQASIVRTRHC
jgi:hypothetical protein